MERRLPARQRGRGIKGPVGVQPPPDFPRRFAAEVGECFAILRPAVSCVADGVAKAAADEVVVEVAADAELVIADAGGVDVVDSCKAPTSSAASARHRAFPATRSRMPWSSLTRIAVASRPTPSPRSIAMRRVRWMGWFGGSAGRMTAAALSSQVDGMSWSDERSGTIASMCDRTQSESRPYLR